MTSLRTNNLGFDRQQEGFLSSKTSRPAMRPTQPAIQWVPGVKRAGSVVDLFPPSSAQVKNEWPHIHSYGVENGDYIF